MVQSPVCLSPRITTDAHSYAGWEPNQDVRAKCYEEFKKTFPDRWKQILKKHDEAQLYAGGTTTMSGRSQAFTKTYKKLKQFVRTHAPLSTEYFLIYI